MKQESCLEAMHVKSLTHPNEKNSKDCISPFRGDSHLFTARMVNFFE